MGLLTFKGGIHPKDGKALAKDQPIKELLPLGELVYPLSQHIGAPAVPLVKKGDHVLKGQKIAEAGGFVSAPVYASVAGTVKAIEMRYNPAGSKVNCIVLENDGTYEEVEYTPITSLKELTKEEIIERISEAGVVGMGGAGFPTKVKLSPKEADKIEYIIANGAECEPYLTSDYRLMLENGEKIIDGIKAVLKIFKNAHAVIAIEDNKPKAIENFESLLKNNSKITVRSLKTRYPQGGERRLIASVTGRKINSHLLPADAGVVVLNIATVNAIYEAVYLGKPLVHRVVTVTGNGVNKPGNFDVPLGISAKYLAEQAGGIKDETVKLISGGPMMGFALSSLDVPVTKTYSSILALTEDDVEKMKTTACIRCGRCVGACPENLVPQLMVAAANANDYERFEKLGGMECIECGCCTYVCPAKRQLTQSFKLAKSQIRSIKAQNKGGKK